MLQRLINVLLSLMILLAWEIKQSLFFSFQRAVMKNMSVTLHVRGPQNSRCLDLSKNEGKTEKELRGLNSHVINVHMTLEAKILI